MPKGRVIRYTNPQRLACGTEWRCAVCGNVYQDEGTARECAEKDHRGKAS